MYEFILPDIGEGISEALLINWSVVLGQEVEEGDEIATVSTDKVDVELPSPRAGVVTELCWIPGDTIKVGAVFMRIDTGENQDISGSNVSFNEDDKEIDDNQTCLSTRANNKAMPINGQVIAAPSTRKLAAELGVDLALVNGNGPDGRILRADVEGAYDAGLDKGILREPLNNVRAVMADRMAQSVHVLAHSTINFEMCAEHFLEALQEFKATESGTDLRISATTLIAKCLSGPLRRHPRFNATIHQNNRELLLHNDVNLGVAMATDRGLIVPVLRQINDLAIPDIAHQLIELMKRTRAGQLQPIEMANGTFTLSNTGGLEEATILSTRPIINAPQTATLWVSKIQKRPVVKGDELKVGMVMNASISFDHRFIDGADAVAFINDFAKTIENPELG